MERQRMSEADREKYLSMVQMKIRDPKVIALIEDDIEYGLSASEIDDYTDRNLKYEQQKMISEMYRKNYPKAVVGAIGRSDMDAEKMRVAMELYDRNVGINEIKKAMAETGTAYAMKKAFDSALSQAQKQLAETGEVCEEAVEKEEESELLLAVKALMEEVQSHSGEYEAIGKMLKQIETISIDEAVTKNLTTLNEKLEKENREFSEELGRKQDEINKGVQTIAQLRNEIEDMKKEMNIMHEKNRELEEMLSQKDETIQEQGQAIQAKNSAIEKIRAERNTPDNTTANGIPVIYTMALMKDTGVTDRTEIECVRRKSSVFESIMSKFACRKKSHRDLIQLVINKELSPEQVNAIRSGLENGLDEEQLELIINKNLTPEKIKSIVSFASLQNSLKLERGVN